MPKLFEHPFLGRGFRPFFLLAALYSVVSLLLWGGFFSGHVTLPEVLNDPISWHAHEMIYGFTMAVVAGFLLTAVANWTGGAPARQIHLGGLCLIWLAGRIVMNFELGLPLWLVYSIEAAFIPALAFSLALPLLRSWNKRNFVFLALLSILFACDIWFFVGEIRQPLYIALLMILIMISLIGGRIIPAFTVAALRRRGEEAYQNAQPKLDVLALISLVALGLTWAFAGFDNPVFSFIAFLSAIVHGLRLRRYHTRRILNDPMVWILHAGYGWLVIGLLMLGFAGLGMITLSTALHALTAGSIGSMTLGMMCRVTLGHTGRNLLAEPVTVLSFILMQVTGIMRVLGPLLMPEYTNSWIIGSAALWAMCFALYVPVYAPMLWTPRPDGREV
ncbi:MAG: NnrS family protein [Rhodospirillales bacterium]|nr:NnrS family protein [Rhodospirillales bacterium]